MCDSNNGENNTGLKATTASIKMLLNIATIPFSTAREKILGRIAPNNPLAADSGDTDKVGYPTKGGVCPFRRLSSARGRGKRVESTPP